MQGLETAPTEADYVSSTYTLKRPYPRPSDEYFARLECAYLAARPNSDAPPRMTVLTAIAGGYEAAPRHEHLMHDARYVVVADDPVACASRATELVSADYFDVDPTRRARFVKTHPYLYAGDCDVIVWIDSNIVVRGDISPIIDRFLASGRPVGALQHPLRSDVYAEGAECIRRGKDDAKSIEDHLARYQGLRFKTDQLVESNFMLFRMDHPKVRPFLSLWWSEIERGSRRDQLSLNYAAEKIGIDFHWITERPNSIRNHPDFALIHHAANAPHEGARLMLPAAPSRGSYRDRFEKLHWTSCDVIVCVHNALQVTKDCLASVAAHRNPIPHHIIIVDDGSDLETASFLRDFAARERKVKLVRHETALGYTKAVNAGLLEASGDFRILLNSDTIVSANFIEKMLDAVQSVPGAGIVGPLSNAASTQSIPDHKSSASQTAVNHLPEGLSPQDMDIWCEDNSPEAFPRTPLVHGFCFGLTADAIRAIGWFDEQNFPFGYGEENDYCFRAAAAGVGLIVATNTYVFHAKSQSYSSEKRAQIVSTSNERVHQLHGKERVRRSILTMQQNPALVEMRTRAWRLYEDAADSQTSSALSGLSK